MEHVVYTKVAVLATIACIPIVIGIIVLVLMNDLIVVIAELVALDRLEMKIER